MTEHTGRCLCGAVQFKATGDPQLVVHCHCESCRRHTAAPIATFVLFEDKEFQVTAGAPKVFESSAETWRSFCGDCGSPLTYRANWSPGLVHVYLGAMDNPGDFPPRFHVNFGEHVSWFDTADKLKRHRSMKKG